MVKTVGMNLLKRTCKRCGHVWLIRKADTRICPKCKSARWNEAK